MNAPMVICAYKRSPFHFAMKGDLARVRPDDMAADVVKALVASSGVKADDIEDLLMGCAFPEAEQGFNLGRIVVNVAGLPISVAGVTVNRFCGSSMTTIQMAAGYAQMGAGEAFLCAGVESMTRIPMGGFNPMPNPKLGDIYPQAYIGMGETAENLAKKYNISRTEQEEFALASQQKAAAAAAAGKFNDEIVAIGDVKSDGTIRPETTLETLAGLKLAFDEKGTVTAGTGPTLNHGGAGGVVCNAN